MSKGFSISVTSNADEVADIMSRIGEKIAGQAEIAALNRTGAQGLTAIRKATASESGVPSREIGKRMKLHRANRSRSTARIFIGTIPIAAYKAGARALKSGVTYSGGRGAARIKLTSGFVATMPSGHVGIFQRTGEPKRVMTRGNYIGQKREPIDEVRIAIEPIARKHANRFVVVDAPRLFRERYEHEFQFRVQKEIERQRK